jgi:hypothetical protein
MREGGGGGGHHARQLPTEEVEMERGGWLGAATQQEEGKGVRQGQAAAVVSGWPATHRSNGGERRSTSRGAQWGSGRGEKRRARGMAWKRKKHGPSPKEYYPF